MLTMVAYGKQPYHGGSKTPPPPLLIIVGAMFDDDGLGVQQAELSRLKYLHVNDLAHHVMLE